MEHSGINQDILERETELDMYVDRYVAEAQANQRDPNTLGTLREDFDSQDEDIVSNEQGWTKRTSKKRKPDQSPLTLSYSDALQQPPTFQGPYNRNTRNTTPQNIKPPKLVLVISSQEVKLGLQNPLVLQRLLNNVAGCVKKINPTKQGNLIIDCFDNVQYRTLLNTSQLGQWAIKVYVPKSLSTTIGCNYNVNIDLSEEEIKGVLECQGVTKVQRLTYYDKGQNTRLPAKTVKLFFNKDVLPKKVIIGFKGFSVKVFVPKPIQCYKCQGFGHMANECRNQSKCMHCSGDHDSRQCTITENIKCANCDGDHKASDMSCPKKVENKQILKKVVTEKVSVQEAKKELLREIKEKKQEKVVDSNKGETIPQGNKLADIIILIISAIEHVPKARLLNQKVSVTVDIAQRVFNQFFDHEYIMEKLQQVQ